MKKFGKIAILAVSIIGMLFLSSCNFYSPSRATAAYEINLADLDSSAGDMASEGASGKMQVTFNKDGTIKEKILIKVLIFKFNFEATGKWTTEGGEGPATNGISYGTMAMEALSIKIPMLGIEEPIVNAGTYNWFVFDQKLYAPIPEDKATLDQLAALAQAGNEEILREELGDSGFPRVFPK